MLRSQGWTALLGAVAWACFAGCGDSSARAPADAGGVDAPAVDAPPAADAPPTVDAPPASDATLTVDAPPAPGGSADGPGPETGDDGLEPIRIIDRVPDGGTLDGGLFIALVIEGEGFTGLDGKIVTARIGDANRPTGRFGSGQTRIDQGAFSFHFPPVLVGGFGLYEFKLIHIDADGDRTCTSADIMFENSSAPSGDPFIWHLTPTSFVKLGPDQVARMCEMTKNWPPL